MERHRSAQKRSRLAPTGNKTDKAPGEHSYRGRAEGDPGQDEESKSTKLRRAQRPAQRKSGPLEEAKSVMDGRIKRGDIYETVPA